MKYIEVTIHLDTVEPFRDLMIDALGNEGPYDSFVEQPDGLKAYVPQAQYDEQFLKTVCNEVGCPCHYEVAEMPDKNWNEEWEKQHQPVLVEDFCWVRAPFHQHRNDVCYEIEIEPKMSFGTAHHATTYMMLTLLRDAEVEGCRVLDMGCGTAVLAILAAMRGAASVEAVDVDEWAYRNAVENVSRNGVEGVVHCMLGDATSLNDLDSFDLILANINRNILLHDIASYVAVLNQGGTICFSGFYESDVPSLVDKATALGLRLEQMRVRQGWCALRFTKQ